MNVIPLLFWRLIRNLAASWTSSPTSTKRLSVELHWLPRELTYPFADLP